MKKLSKKSILSYVSGFLTAILLTVGIVVYASTTKTIQAEFSNIKVYIDNVLVDLKDANGSTVEPFICDGTTYLPVRGVASALGCQVEWDEATQSVKLYKNVASSDIYQSEGQTTASLGYEQIYNEYSKKIKDAAPNVGISELAEISNEGIGKMAKYMLKAQGKDGQYETYQEWAGKLMDVYLKEAR